MMCVTQEKALAGVGMAVLDVRGDAFKIAFMAPAVLLSGAGSSGPLDPRARGGKHSLDSNSFHAAEVDGTLPEETGTAVHWLSHNRGPAAERSRGNLA